MDASHGTIHVIEKPALARQYMRHGILKESDIVKYFLEVFDTRCEECMFYKHEDEQSWYNRGRKTDMVSVDINSRYAPDKSIYICPRPGSADKANNGFSPYSWWNMNVNSRKDMDKPSIVFHIYRNSVGLYQDHMLAAMHYIQYMGIDLDICYVQAVDERYVKGRNIMPFMDAWQSVVQEGWMCFGTYPANPIKKLLNQSGMSIKDFADYFGISYRTVQNWGLGASAVPKWALPLFELKLLTEHII